MYGYYAYKHFCVSLLYEMYLFCMHYIPHKTKYIIKTRVLVCVYKSVKYLEKYKLTNIMIK